MSWPQSPPTTPTTSANVLRQQLLNTPETRWRTAKYRGTCTSCGTGYERGTAIKAPNWGAGRWVAECCAQNYT